jgi:hypothetical protein
MFFKTPKQLLLYTKNRTKINYPFFSEGKNSSEPLYFGYRFEWVANQDYMSGGAGYVLSRY